MKRPRQQPAKEQKQPKATKGPQAADPPPPKPTKRCVGRRIVQHTGSGVGSCWEWRRQARRRGNATLHTDRFHPVCRPDHEACPGCGLLVRDLFALHKPGRRGRKASAEALPANKLTKEFIQQHVEVGKMSLRLISEYHPVCFTNFFYLLRLQQP